MHSCRCLTHCFPHWTHISWPASTLLTETSRFCKYFVDVTVSLSKITMKRISFLQKSDRRITQIYCTKMSGSYLISWKEHTQRLKRNGGMVKVAIFPRYVGFSGVVNGFGPAFIYGLCS